MLKELFSNCAWNIVYQEIGNGVNYAFVEDGDKLTIYFEGSRQKIDWWRNFLFTQKVYKMFRVHRGFYEAYSEVRDVLINKVMEYSLTNKRFRWQEIVVVGYSHGGGICQIAFEDIAYHRSDIINNIKGYAFESPRCLKVPRKYRDSWNGLLVIRTNQDLVCRLPPRIFGYRHQGKMLKIKGDTSLVENKWLPKCIKSHYPQVVYQALKEYEK